MITYVGYIFGTYTYTRDIPISLAWSKTSKDWNRYVHRLRRLHNCSVEYLRSVESHADGYPHLHAVLRFPIPITVQNSKYVDRNLYLKWKKLWKSGISDYQVPRSKGNSAILYIIKYVTKQTTVKSFWKNYYALIAKPPLKDSDIIGKSDSLEEKKSNSGSYVPPVESELILTLKKYKIKQLSWSRKFFAPTLISTASTVHTQTLIAPKTK